MEKVAATLLFLLYLTSAQQERCGIIGNSDETAATPSRLQFFYLNAAYPAPCTGNITSWRVCYHGPDTLDISGSYWATYAVYQRNSGNSVRYVRVSEMFRAIRTVTNFISVEEADGEIAQGGFNCYNDSINSPLTIQAGDILGVCVFTPDNSFGINRFPLDVIGEASGESLLQMTGTSDCSREDIPSDIDISANQFLTLNSRRLHIYANIEVEPATIPSISIAAATTTIRVTGIEFQTITGSTLATTESVSACSMETTADIVYDTEGNQTRVVALAAGAAGGGLLLLLLLVVSISTIVCLTMRKWKLYINQTVKYSSNDKIATNTNVAYKPVLHTTTVNAEFGIMHGTTEPQQSSENQDSKLNMEHNVAYTPFAQISLTSNVAYHKSGKPLEENDDQTEYYDYI